MNEWLVLAGVLAAAAFLPSCYESYKHKCHFVPLHLKCGCIHVYCKWCGKE